MIRGWYTPLKMTGVERSFILPLHSADTLISIASEGRGTYIYVPQHLDKQKKGPSPLNSNQGGG